MMISETRCRLQTKQPKIKGIWKSIWEPGQVLPDTLTVRLGPTCFSLLLLLDFCSCFSNSTHLSFFQFDCLRLLSPYSDISTGHFVPAWFAFAFWFLPLGLPPDYHGWWNNLAHLILPKDPSATCLTRRVPTFSPPIRLAHIAPFMNPI